MATVHELLESIYRSRGRLVPSEVVDEARPEDHPLHSRFTWDDGEAAELWREEEARHLIRAVKVSVEVVNHGKVVTTRVRAFPCINTDDGDTYVPLAIVESRPDMQEILLSQMRTEIGYLKRKFEAHAELFRMVLSEESAA